MFRHTAGAEKKLFIILDSADESKRYEVVQQLSYRRLVQIAKSLHYS